MESELFCTECLSDIDKAARQVIQTDHMSHNKQWVELSFAAIKWQQRTGCDR
jgi:hypothetical protein